MGRPLHKFDFQWELKALVARDDIKPSTRKKHLNEILKKYDGLLAHDTDYLKRQRNEYKVWIG